MAKRCLLEGLVATPGVCVERYRASRVYSHRRPRSLALASYPSFNPNIFAKPLTKREYSELEGGGGSGGGRLTNRAVNGAYPTGSTFKPITAMAALEAGVITPSEGLGAGKCISVSTEHK